jgi:hypothetical protein
MFREFLAPQVTISATRISPWAPMLIRVESHRGQRRYLRTCLGQHLSTCPTILSLLPTPVACGGSVGCSRGPTALSEGCSSTAVSRADGALFHWKAFPHVHLQRGAYLTLCPPDRTGDCVLDTSGRELCSAVPSSNLTRLSVGNFQPITQSPSAWFELRWRHDHIHGRTSVNTA